MSVDLSAPLKMTEAERAIHESPLQERDGGGPEVIRGGLNFGHALFWLKGGFPLRRHGWGERWIELRSIYGRDVIGCVYLRHGEPVWMGPFIAAQEDLLAEDWEILA